MISSDVIRDYNDTIILYPLRSNNSYGYEISKSIKEISEEKYIIKETKEWKITKEVIDKFVKEIL